MKRTLLLPCLLPLWSGCGERCEDVSRLDGGWAVYLEPAQGTATGAASYPWDDVFTEGWSEWDLEYVPARSEFRLDLDAQPFTATYIQDDTRCDAFVLRFDGTYLGEEGSVHTVEWTGELQAAGTHILGTYDFTDDWRDPSSGDNGTMQLAGGDFTGNRRED